jgi:ferritin-like metal-binding protein YciE
MIDDINKKPEENSENNEDTQDSFNTENLRQGKKTIIKKTGAYSEFEVISEDKTLQKNGAKSNSEKKDSNNNSATIDEHQMGPSMGISKDENTFTATENQNSNKAGGNKLKARLQNFIAGLGQDKITIKGEYKGDVNINDVKNSSEKDTFESRLKQTEKQQETLDKTIENNANRNGVVRRILAKLEEKIEKNPELAERFDTKAEIIKHVGHVPSSQMSHVDKIIARSQEIQGKGPMDF